MKIGRLLEVYQHQTKIAWNGVIARYFITWIYRTPSEGFDLSCLVVRREPIVAWEGQWDIAPQPGSSVPCFMSQSGDPLPGYSSTG